MASVSRLLLIDFSKSSGKVKKGFISIHPHVLPSWKSFDNHNSNLQKIKYKDRQPRKRRIYQRYADNRTDSKLHEVQTKTVLHSLIQGTPNSKETKSSISNWDWIFYRGQFLLPPTQKETEFICSKIKNNWILSLVPGPSNILNGANFIGVVFLEISPQPSLSGRSPGRNFPLEVWSNVE